MKTEFPLCPKNPNGPLKVILIGRISTEHQNLESIDASFRYAQEFLARLYDGPVEFKQLGERASGMLVDRATIREAEDLIATGEWDLVLAEDLSRIFRNPRHQLGFVQDTVDSETRVICIADNIDTASDHWEVMLGAAALRHGTMIPDTRRRVRRSATHAFHSGGMVLRVKYGYRRLSKEDAATGLHGSKGLRIARRPECTPVIRLMVAKLLAGAHLNTISEWLQSERVEPPPYAKRWTPRLVRNLLADPILSGTRTFRKVLHQPVYRTGRHRRVPNAAPEQAAWPELAHLEPEEHARVLDVIGQRQQVRANKRGADHPLFGIPRSRSIWPGQHLRCAICGGLLYYVGFKQLKCRNTLGLGGSECWNRVQVRSSVAQLRIVDWLLEAFGHDAAFCDSLVNAALEERERRLSLSQTGTAELTKEIAVLERQAANVSQAIAAGGKLQPLLEKLQEVNTALERARQRFNALAAERPDKPEKLDRPAVAARLRELLLHIVATDREFADVMRRVLRDCRLYPVQALHTPLIRPQLRFTLQLQTTEPTNPDSKRPDVGAQFVLDLFDPPAHIRHLQRCLEHRKCFPKHTYKQIGQALGIGIMTVKRAFDYARLMAQAAAIEPYRELTVRPDVVSRWR